MKTWNCFPILSAPMPFQMALDEIFFRRMLEDRLEMPLLRFYFSSEPWISVGYSHPDENPYRSLGVSESGSKGILDTPTPRHSETIPMCRRITGGGKVEHGKDVIFSLTARKEHDESFSSVRVSYWKIHEAVRSAFERIGETTRFYRCDEKLPRGGECFVYPIATDLELDGKKVAGGAQKRSRGVLLHQESIQLPPRLNAPDFIRALKVCFEKQFQIRLQDMDCDPDLLEEAKQWAKKRGRTPQLDLQEAGV